MEKTKRARKGGGTGGKTSPNGSAVTHAYNGLKALIRSCEIKPGDRINELELARRFNVSRTPLREALNQLAVERLLVTEQNVGFSRPKINLELMVNLYEVRVVLESTGVRLAIERATDDEIDDLIAFWEELKTNSDDFKREELISADEEFHERLIGLSHNPELVHYLRGINARIHFVRWASRATDASVDRFHYSQIEIVHAVKARDERRALECLRSHIVRSREQLMDVMKDGVAILYIL